MDFICVLFHLSSLLIPSSVSVLFNLNASLNAVAPASPITLSDDLMRLEKRGLLVDSMRVVFCCLYH